MFGFIGGQWRCPGLSFKRNQRTRYNVPIDNPSNNGALVAIRHGIGDFINAFPTAAFSLGKAVAATWISNPHIQEILESNAIDIGRLRVGFRTAPSSLTM